MTELKLMYDIKQGKVFVHLPDGGELGYIDLKGMVYQLDPRSNEMNILLTVDTDITSSIIKHKVNKLLGDTE